MTDSLRVFGLMLVRDEADIVGQTLSHARRYCDRVFVLDNGSTDGTAELLEDLQASDPGIVLSIRSSRTYHKGMRRLLFDKHADVARAHDWWHILDADEFLPLDPRAFLFRAGDAGEGKVYMRMLEFALTLREADAWRRGEETPEDRKRPILERRRLYRSVNYEPRFFRHAACRAWPSDQNAPFVRGRVSRQTLPLLHFPHRDPDQVARRIALRRKLQEEAKNGQIQFKHVASERVEDYLVPEAELTAYDPAGMPFLREAPRPIPFPVRENGAYFKWRLKRFLRG